MVDQFNYQTAVQTLPNGQVAKILSIDTKTGILIDLAMSEPDYAEFLQKISGKAILTTSQMPTDPKP